MNGTVILKPEVTSLSDSGATFMDGTTLNDLDTIILCTGYQSEYSFDKENILQVPSESNPLLYKFVFPINLKHHTLAVIGRPHPTIGAVNISNELQSRWAVRVFKVGKNICIIAIILEDKLISVLKIL